MGLSPERKRHWLRRNHGTRTPQTIVAIACEPIGTELERTRNTSANVLSHGVACCQRLEAGKNTRKDWFEFASAADFWTWLETRYQERRAVWLVSANLFRDLQLLGFWELLADDEPLYKLAGFNEWVDSRETDADTFRGLLCLANPPTIVLARRGEFSVTMVDLRNYFPSDEKALGKMLGAELLPRPGDSADADEWIAYTSRRCRICQEAIGGLVEVWKREDLGVWQFTAAGLAWRAFRHRFMQPRSILIDDHGPAAELSRKALVGGEARCFFRGQVVPPDELRGDLWWDAQGPGPAVRPGPVVVVDATSFYAGVMHSNLFPRELAAYKERGELADLAEWRKYLALVAEVELDTPDEPYPYVHNGPEGRQRYFAVGRFATVLCGPELARALDLGHVRGVGRIAAYLPGRLFQRYVEHFWSKRCGSEGAERELYKLLLVALPGKFGQRTPQWVETGEVFLHQKWGEWPRADVTAGTVEVCRSVAGYVQRRAEPEEGPNSFPAVEAFVNAYGRDFLRNVRAQLPAAEVLYQDTDSLHLTEIGFEHLQALGLVGDNTLGIFREVGRYDRATYWGVKAYEVDGEAVIAGLPRVRLPSGRGAWEVTTWEGADSLIGRGPDGTALSYRSLWHVTDASARGRVLKSGAVMPALVKDGKLILRAPRRMADRSKPPGTRTPANPRSARSHRPDYDT